MIVDLIKAALTIVLLAVIAYYISKFVDIYVKRKPNIYVFFIDELDNHYEEMARRHRQKYKFTYIDPYRRKIMSFLSFILIPMNILFYFWVYPYL